MQEKIKQAFVPAVIVLVAGISFGLGRLSKIDSAKIPLVIEQEAIIPPTLVKEEVRGASTVNTTGKYVASRNGTKYYFPWCSGAKRISPQNLVSFATKQEAEAKGLGPAANCPGL